MTGFDDTSYLSRCLHEAPDFAARVIPWLDRLDDEHTLEFAARTHFHDLVRSHLVAATPKSYATQVFGTYHGWPTEAR